MKPFQFRLQKTGHIVDFLANMRIDDVFGNLFEHLNQCLPKRTNLGKPPCVTTDGCCYAR